MCFKRPCNRERLNRGLSNISTNVFCGNSFVGIIVETGVVPVAGVLGANVDVSYSKIN